MINYSPPISKFQAVLHKNITHLALLWLVLKYYTVAVIMPTALKKLALFKHKKILIGVILILAAGGLILFKSHSSKPKVELGQVKIDNIATVVSTSGSLTGSGSASLHFQGGGKLSNVNVSPGQIVEKGQTIASLDTQALAIALQQAENSLSSAQATTEKTVDDIHLFQYGNGGFNNVGSANETEAQKQERMNAQAASNNAYDAVRAAERNFDDAVITSPIAGVITQANFQPGQTVSPTDIIARVVNFETIVFEADVDESDIGQIQLNQNAQVTLNAYADKTFDGQVIEIEPTTHTTSNGATAVTVKIKLNDQTISKIDGLNGQASIVTDSKNQVLVIPLEALQDDQTVVVSDGQNYKTVKVITGLQSDTTVEIQSGLTAGQKIVLNPSTLKKG